jgi:uncharacterized membrane protein
MTDTQKEIWASIRAECADLPEESVRRALEFYEEYFADALEAGHSEEETLERLGGVKEIASQMRVEAALTGAERRPGPFRLIGARRQVLRGLAGSAAKFSMILGASIPYTLALGFYLTAVAAFIGALAMAALMGYGITTMPNADIMAKIGTAAMGLFSAALLSGAGLGLWASAKGITRITLRKLREGLRRDRRVDRQPQSVPPRAGKLKTAFLVCAVAALAGIAGAFPSSLPMKLFSIWNSMKPGNLAIRTWSYPPAEIREMEISTMNSEILLETAADSQEAIRITYEEPEWLTGKPAVAGKKLVFREVSSGTLPFMDFIAMHAGTTSIRITVPRGYSARAITLENGSGNVSLAIAAEITRVDTGSGSIRFDAGKSACRIRVSTPRGHVIVKGKAWEGGSYEAGAAGAVVELKTGNGTVDIR